MTITTTTDAETTIKDHLTRALASLEQIGRSPHLTLHKGKLYEVHLVTFQYCRALNLSAMKHSEGNGLILYYDDARENLETALRSNLQSFLMSRPTVVTAEAILAAVELEKMIQILAQEALPN